MNPQLSESFLVEEYFRKDKTMKQIALENGYAVGTIFNWMKYYGIPVRHGFTKAGLENLRLRNSRRRGTKRPPFTEEHKARISAAKKGKYKRPPNTVGIPNCAEMDISAFTVQTIHAVTQKVM